MHRLVVPGINTDIHTLAIPRQLAVGMTIEMAAALMAVRPTTVSIVTQPDTLARAKLQLVDILDPGEGDPSNRPSLVVVAENQMYVAV